MERATYSNEAQPGNDEAYYNIAEITTFIRTEELQRVISEKDTKENNAFLEEYKVVLEFWCKVMSNVDSTSLNTNIFVKKRYMFLNI